MDTKDSKYSEEIIYPWDHMGILQRMLKKAKDDWDCPHLHESGETRNKYNIMDKDPCMYCADPNCPRHPRVIM